MDFLQRARNPWGQEVLVRISWNLFWLALLAGALFLAFHLLFRRQQRSRASEAPTVELAALGKVPERIVRHGLTARLFHLVMAASMLVLLATGFLPKVGLQFSWLTTHWVAGVILIASILFHIVHATFFQSLRNIWISLGDAREWIQEMRHAISAKTPAPPRPGKYPVDHKLYHHAVTASGFAAMITGVLMMFRIETPFFVRNPYLYTDATWGWIYVLHGLSSVVLVTLTITHVYFAILPEKRWITWSMVFGWISKADFIAHHDPRRWPPEGRRQPEAPPENQATAAADAATEAS